jgi:hypothetical protein
LDPKERRFAHSGHAREDDRRKLCEQVEMRRVIKTNGEVGTAHHAAARPPDWTYEQSAASFAILFSPRLVTDRHPDIATTQRYEQLAGREGGDVDAFQNRAGPSWMVSALRGVRPSPGRGPCRLPIESDEVNAKLLNSN